jgi:pilus assembly protein Flp/PilA
MVCHQATMACTIMMLRLLAFIQSRAPLGQRGATAIEYGLIAGMLAIGIILSLKQMGNTLSNFFATAGNHID